MRVFLCCLILFLCYGSSDAQSPSNELPLTPCQVRADPSVFDVVDRVMATFVISGTNMPYTAQSTPVSFPFLSPVDELWIRSFTADGQELYQEFWVACKDSLTIGWDSEQEAFTTTASTTDRHEKYATFLSWSAGQTDRQIVDRLKERLVDDRFSAYSSNYLRFYADTFGEDTTYHREILGVFSEGSTYQSPEVGSYLGEFRKAIVQVPVTLREYSLEGYGDDRLRSAARTKPLLIKLWFVTCAPCIRDSERIISDRKSGTFPDTELIAISIDQQSDTWTARLDDHPEDWPNFRFRDKVDFFALMSTVGERRTLPVYVLLDKDNLLVETFQSYAEAKEFLEAR